MNFTSADLLQLLQERGVNCNLESPFRPLRPLTQDGNRVLCVEGSFSPCKATGISFWLHTGSGLLFLGLWSGVLLKVCDPSRAADLAIDLLSGVFIKKGVMPTSLPKTLVKDYELQQGELLSIWPENEFDNFEELIESTMPLQLMPKRCIDALLAQVDSYDKDGEFIEIRVGSARAIARFQLNKAEQQELGCLFVYGGFVATNDHFRLLQIVDNSMQCAMYDMSWGNRIHLDDPYYSVHYSGERPSEPKNAFEN